MTLLEPIYLLLCVPLAFVWRRWPPPSGWRRLWRLVGGLLLVLALCRPVIWLPRSTGTVVVLVDRSASMPESTESLAEEVIRRLDGSRRPEDRLAVVSFGQQPVLEPFAVAGGFAGFRGQVGDQQSRLAAAVQRGLALTPSGGQGRLLILSDGRPTDGSLERVAGLANLQNVAVDYRLIERPSVGDVAIERLDVPLQVSPGEAYMLNAWVSVPRPQTVRFELWRGDRRIAEGHRDVPSGSSRLTFRDRAAGPGVEAYRLVVQGDDVGDGLPQNNTARFLVTARGPHPVLLVTERLDGALGPLLRGAGLRVESRTPGELSGRLDDWAGYSAVLLENVAAQDLGTATLEQLTAWVRDTGAGLMITGGRQSFGLGGYYESPLEDALPVSMELRQEHRKLPLAMVVALDRSGSMAVSVDARLDKMDLANRATVAVMDLLLPMDEFGVLAVDSAPYVVRPLAPLTETANLRRDILAIDSMGGGIFVHEALVAASRQLLDSKATIRHILLFADAADAENPGDYRRLLATAREAGISVSVVGLGTAQDTDADLLRDIADRGGGRVYFSERAQELPQLFAQDTFLVSRSAFVEEATDVRLTAGFELLSGGRLPSPPSVGGYNLTYARPEAQVAGHTGDDHRAPWITTWTYGLGRVVALTSEVDGEFSGAIGQWAENGSLLSALVRWAAGDPAGPRDAVVTQVIDGGRLDVQVHLDPRSPNPWLGTSTWRALRGAADDGVPATATGNLRWRDPLTLEASIELSEDDVTLAGIQLAGGGRISLPAVRLPYSPEYRPAVQGDGRRTLETLAQATGGRQRLDVGGIWRTFPRQRRSYELTPWLLILASLCLLLEVLERRTAWLSLWTSRRRMSRSPQGVPGGAEAAAPGGGQQGADVKRAGGSRSHGDSSADSSPESPPDTPSDRPPADDGLSAALADAKRRARGRRR